MTREVTWDMTPEFAPPAGLIDIVSPAPRDLWRQALAADPDALFSQTPEWLDVICAIDGWRDASRLYVWPNGRRLVLPMVAKGVGEVVAVEGSFPPGWDYGGLVGGAVTPDEAAAVCADLTARRLLRQHILPNPLQGNAWSQAIAQGAPGALAIPCRAHVVDLEGGAGAAWNRFSSDARRRIRKAEKQGLEVECDTTGRLLDVFDELWSASVRRWTARSGEPLWLARLRGRRAHPLSRWRQIAERTSGAVAIWVARYRGEPAAAMVVLRGPNDHDTRGAMDKELAGPTSANLLLEWFVIQDACRRGVRWLQMGRSGQAGSPIGRFKENFGARAYEFPEVLFERLPITRLVRAARAAVKHAIVGGPRPST